VYAEKGGERERDREREETEMEGERQRERALSMSACVCVYMFVCRGNCRVLMYMCTSLTNMIYIHKYKLPISPTSRGQ